MSTDPGALRRRLSLTLGLLVIGAAALVGLALWLSDQYIEDAAIQDLLEHELESLVATSSSPQDKARRPSTLIYYRPRLNPEPAVPSAVYELPPGYHQEIEIGGASFNVLVRDLGPGDRVWLTYDVSFVERRESGLAATLGILLLLLAATTPWLARSIAKRMLAPLDELVTQLRTLNPERRGERLALPAAESEVLVMAQALNNYMAQLDALVERERVFAAAASHELRTPLAVIQGAAEMLALTAPTAAPLKRIERALREARQSLDSLLALSRVWEKPPLQTLQLAQLLPELAEHYALERPDTRLRWDITQPVPLQAPPGAAAVVFTNLLRNALRAGRGGEVSVRIEPGRVVILDNGPGIPEQELPHVFDPGFSGRDGGTGMGLYVARALATRYGWTLELVNRPGGGAEARWNFKPA
jgi:signal transduction histidine kinase